MVFKRVNSGWYQKLTKRFKGGETKKVWEPLYYVHISCEEDTMLLTTGQDLSFQPHTMVLGNNDSLNYADNNGTFDHSCFRETHPRMIHAHWLDPVTSTSISQFLTQSYCMGSKYLKYCHLDHFIIILQCPPLIILITWKRVHSLKFLLLCSISIRFGTI